MCAGFTPLASACLTATMSLNWPTCVPKGLEDAEVERLGYRRAGTGTRPSGPNRAAGEVTGILTGSRLFPSSSCRAGPVSSWAGESERVVRRRRLMVVVARPTARFAGGSVAVTSCSIPRVAARVVLKWYVRVSKGIDRSGAEVVACGEVARPGRPLHRTLTARKVTTS